MMIMLVLCVTAVEGLVKMPTKDNYTVKMEHIFVEYRSKDFFKHFDVYSKYINRKTKLQIYNFTTRNVLDVDSWFELKYYQMRSNTFHSATPMNFAMRVKDCLNSGFAGVKNMLESSNITHPYIPLKPGSYTFIQREEQFEGTTAVPYMASGEYKIVVRIHTKTDHILDLALYSNAKEKVKRTRSGRSTFT